MDKDEGKIDYRKKLSNGEFEEISVVIGPHDNVVIAIPGSEREGKNFMFSGEHIKIPYQQYVHKSLIATAKLEVAREYDDVVINLLNFTQVVIDSLMDNGDGISHKYQEDLDAKEIAVQELRKKYLGDNL